MLGALADQPYIINYRIYNDRVGEITRFAYSRQKPTKVSMLKCYDLVTDSSVWVGLFLLPVLARSSPRSQIPWASRLRPHCMCVRVEFVQYAVFVPIREDSLAKQCGPHPGIACR